MARQRSDDNSAATWDDALRQLAPVNGAVEVGLAGEDEAQVAPWRTRLLSVSDGGIVIQLPDADEAVAHMRRDAEVVLYLMLGQARVAGRCRVGDVGRYKLSASSKVTALQLDHPASVHSAQRRAAFRLSTAATPSIGLMLTLPGHASPTPCRLLDVSEFGVGLSLRMELETAEQWLGLVVSLTMQLPMQPPLSLSGEVVRAAPGGYPNPTIGVRFKFDSDGAARRAQRQLQQFTAAQQRAQLRRLRGTA